ncbi:hypothetical protein [Streptomyces atratus]|uniref:hypothetical protein n=1 Tax=Streptomyces atratus TaxID=1893 RepID=UPI0013009BAE|nr:hypothetical protein [Streptomyces atratus]
MPQEQSPEVAELHRQCAQDYREAAPQRVQAGVQAADATAAGHAGKAAQAERGHRS